MNIDTADKHQQMPDMFQSLAAERDKHSKTESEAGEVLWDNLREPTSTGVGHSCEWEAMEDCRPGQDLCQLNLQLPDLLFWSPFSPHLVPSFSLGSFSHQQETEGLTVASMTPLASSLSLSASQSTTLIPSSAASRQVVSLTCVCSLQGERPAVGEQAPAAEGRERSTRLVQALSRTCCVSCSSHCPLRTSAETRVVGEARGQCHSQST